ncbi:MULTISPECIES: DUF2523 family protein [Stenotrophomonas]|uniref:DUF2523 family protein n=1 Tax=Stenotrophomonas TaxID=40323 RepID=UPI000539410E|nr:MULTISPECIES: DUF2523 family protein [Stenotrophomonas]ELN2583081.1 DUF2523 domain-containing protein [Stenotrophomonas maltophilia]MDG2511027.1 DUF2523 family protein [Stenotrophomonas maltophilia]MDH2178261.1 DUF2523 family protein [Stenotrophomonas sp. GD03654]HDS1836080.1 DUF2523 domain-containing protein [Stenotrophomonas maltophilia]HEL3173531.1 DUF2523 domain-containing protein [Stenotrophomonas maltophilia]
MPWLISSLLTGLAGIFRSKWGPWVTEAMVWLGLSWATNEFLVDPWIQQMEQAMRAGAPGGEFGALVVAYAGIMKFDVACTMIASAVTAKFAVGAVKTVLTKRT